MKKDNIHAGHRTRLLNKILKHGFDGVEDHEMLEAMLYACYRQADTNEIAHSLLHKFEGLHSVCGAPVGELTKIENVGIKTALYLNILPEFVKSYQVSCFGAKPVLRSVEEIAQYCIALQTGNIHEVAYVLCLDVNGKLLKKNKLAEGNPGSVLLDPRKVLEEVTHTPTAKVVLCHNHPGGTLLPSQNDFDATANVKVVLKAIGIELLDHIIVVKDKYISFRSENYKF